MSETGPAPEKPPVVARPASTALILRDGTGGIEIFMVVRHEQIAFATGAMVFPGGRVDGIDGDPAWADFAPLADASQSRDFVVAAARETFEEAGLLIARRRGETALLGAGAAQALVTRYRNETIKRPAAFLDMVRTEGLELATDLMVPYAHWITPEHQPKRFDTHFLLIAAPVTQLGAHDGSESVEGLWITPSRALEEGDAGTRKLMFPTIMNLQKLARHATVAQAVAEARASPVVTVLPRAEFTPQGRVLHIPAEAGYGITSYMPPHSAVESR